jgi:hypothetical protein
MKTRLLGKRAKTPSAPGVQKMPAVLPFSAERKGNTRGLNRGPAGNQFARTHGFRAVGMSDEERAGRKAQVARMITEKGGSSAISEPERTLIETASWLQVKLSRVWKTIEEGGAEPDSAHVLAAVNSLRLILCALGLEKRKPSGPSLEQYLQKKAASRGEQA